MLHHLIASGVEHPPPFQIMAKHSTSNKAESPEVPPSLKQTQQPNLIRTDGETTITSLYFIILKRFKLTKVLLGEYIATISIIYKLGVWGVMAYSLEQREFWKAVKNLSDPHRLMFWVPEKGPRPLDGDAGNSFCSI